MKGWTCSEFFSFSSPRITLVPAWRVFVLASCPLGCDSPLCPLPRKTLWVPCSYSAPGVGSVWALEQRMCLPTVIRALPCGLSPPLESCERPGSRSYCSEDPKDMTVWTSEEGWVMCLKWQAGVVLLLAKWLPISDRTEQD